MKQKIKYGFFTFCLSPLLSLLLNLKCQMLYLKEKLNLENEELYKQKSEFKYHLRSIIKLELGLETIFQLTLQLILLFNATSETRTNEAFNVVFNDDLAKWTIVVSLMLSTMWSFVSCSLAHIKGLMVRRDHFPAVPKLMAMLGSMFSITKHGENIVSRYYI